MFLSRKQKSIHQINLKHLLGAGNHNGSMTTGALRLFDLLIQKHKSNFPCLYHGAQSHV